MQKCFAVLMSDPKAAIGAVVHDRAAGGGIFPTYIDYLRTGYRASGKPAVLVANRQGTSADPLVVEATREGFPVLDGLESFLRGVKHLLDHRDFAARATWRVRVIPEAALAKMRARLADRRRFDENDALTLLGDAGLPANAGSVVESEAAAVAAAKAIGYPVVLKTAKRGLDHKSDQQGIHLGLADAAAVASAYRDLAKRIDARVLVAPMISAHGVELLLGMVNDPQFGLWS